jgi:uncharacterized membrane protein YjgN (DUF898 family)
MIRTKNWIGKACNMNRSIEKCMQNFSQNFKGSTVGRYWQIWEVNVLVGCKDME